MGWFKRRCGEEIISHYDAMSDVQYLAGREIRNWRDMDRALRASGDPTALAGGFAGLEYGPPPLALPATTAVTTIQLMWPTLWTPIAANPQAPKAYRISAFGTVTASTTAGTEIITPGIGLTTGAVTLGASPAMIPGLFAASLWELRGQVIIRVGGGASTATAIGSFNWLQVTANAGAGVAGNNYLFGTTVASFDSTVAQALAISSTVTQTTTLLTPLGITWSSWN